MLKRNTSAPSTRTTGARNCVAAAIGALLLASHAPGLAAIVDESGAKLAPTKDSNAAGTATFSSAGKDGVRIKIEVSGLKPGSEHGWHVHEKGDCSAPDATSAGGHFSLQGQQHGPQEGDKYHAGDLGNLKADAQGKASKTLLVPDSKLTLASGPAKKPRHAGAFTPTRLQRGCEAAGLQNLDVRSLFAFGAGDHVKRNLLVLLEGLETRPLDCGMMCKDVFTTAIRADEAETLRIIEPLDCTCTHLLS